MIDSTSSLAARLAATAVLLSAALAPAPVDALCAAFVPPTGYAASGACGPDATPGTTCPVTCDSAVGYVGSAVPVVCTTDGQWTSPTGCVLATCGAPAAPSAYAVSCPATTYGTSCSISCAAATGYVGTPSSSSATCGIGGWSVSFSSLTGCHLATCGEFPSQPGYAASCTSTSFGGTCTLTCDTAHGYEGVPSQTPSVCQLDGQWSLAGSALSGCALHDCGSPVHMPGYVLACSGTTWGSACTLACDAAAGFLGAPSPASTTCTFAGWSVAPGAASGCALADCGALTLANADTADCTAHSRYGEACVIACSPGFGGSPAASCSASGAWNVSGSCDPIACWPSPSTNGDSCGGSGVTCLSGECVTPEAGQLCTLPFDLALGVPSAFPLDRQHDLLSTGGCTGGVAAGKDVFVRAAVTAGDYRLSVNSTAGSAVQAVVLGDCSPVGCSPLSLAPEGEFLSTTVSLAAAETALLAVHVLDPVAAGTLEVTLAREEARSAPPERSDSGSGCTSGRGGVAALALLAALGLLSSRRRTARQGRR